MREYQNATSYLLYEQSGGLGDPDRRCRAAVRASACGAARSARHTVRHGTSHRSCLPHFCSLSCILVYLNDASFSNLRSSYWPFLFFASLSHILMLLCIYFAWVLQLALKHRQGKNHKMRIVIFVGSPIVDEENEVCVLAPSFSSKFSTVYLSLGFFLSYLI